MNVSMSFISLIVPVQIGFELISLWNYRESSLFSIYDKMSTIHVLSGED